MDALAGFLLMLAPAARSNRCSAFYCLLLICDASRLASSWILVLCFGGYGSVMEILVRSDSSRIFHYLELFLK